MYERTGALTDDYAAAGGHRIGIFLKTVLTHALRGRERRLLRIGRYRRRISRGVR